MDWNANYAGKPEIITEATDDGLLIGWNGEFEGEKKIIVSLSTDWLTASFVRK